MLDMLLGFLLPIPEFATSQEFSPYIVVPQNAPIKIDACEATQAKQRGVVAHSSVSYGTAFTVLGTKTATRVKIRFAFDDRNWHPVVTKDEDLTGTFSPDTKISRTRKIGGGFGQSGVMKDAVAVVCTPVEVQFSDGSVWHGVEVPSTRPASTSAPATMPPSSSARPAPHSTVSPDDLE